MSARPRIGITIERDAGEGSYREYVAAVERAGGEAIVLEPGTRSAADAVAGVDGLLLSGGEDVDPARYGAAAHPSTERASDARDAFESEIAELARERGVATLAICRGIQLANVAFGGTLVQHVPERFGASVPHRLEPDGQPAERGLLDGHIVHPADDSLLARIAGTAPFPTGSRHHQSIDALAGGFRVVARAPDGVIEAIEPEASGGFWLGVQWHPESTLDADDGGASRAIFAAFVAAARGER